ncbi:MAG: AAA family ATPase [Patescibacteria group bacterium]|nr:AAA family ATPase [Patescibacteria group bacterium]
MSRPIIVTGVSAAGKDFLIGKVKETIPQLRVFNFGDRLADEMRKRVPELRDSGQLKNFDREEIRKEIENVTNYLLEQGVDVVNTHLVFCSNTDLIVTPPVTRRISPKGFVFVWAPLDEIVQRRQRDLKNREIQNESEVALHQDIALYVAARFAKEMKVPYLKICNRCDNVRDNVDKLVRFVTDLS